jgi:large-conductance mechanosensitive channel
MDFINIAYNKAFSNFITFLETSNVLQLGIAFVLSMNVNKLSNDFIDNIIAPIINRLFDITKTTTLSERVLEVGGIRFKLGNFFTSILKFVITLYFLYIIYSIAGIKPKK